MSAHGTPADPPPPDLGRSIELVRRLQGGDQSALNELLARYRERVRRIIRIRMGPELRRHMDEDDVLQEVLLVAARKLKDLELKSRPNLLQWLARVVELQIKQKSQHYSAFKRSALNEARPGAETGAGLLDFLPAPGPTPSQQAVWTELEQLVDSYVERLEPAEYREVILARDYCEAGWEEVRAQLDRPTVEAAQELYRRAHAKLRERMHRHLERD